MSKKIAVIDTNISNLRNVVKALKFYNLDYKIIQSGKELNNFGYVIMPGVGSFGKGMDFLRENQFIESINQHVLKGNFLMGICLGCQLLLDSSSENGNHNGLSLISGKVKKIIHQNNLKIPNVGWSKLIIKKNNNIFTDISKNEYFYFTHSYVCFPSYEKNTIAYINFGKQILAASIQKDNIFGFQFHPELSGNIGKKIYYNFLKLD